MTDNAGSGGDAFSCQQEFTGADKMRLTSLTHKIIEELRTRRDSAANSEKKIQILLNDRFTMGWKLDQESSKLTSLNEKHETERRETVRQMEEKIKDYRIEATQHQVYRTTVETEKETLKEEIRKLQLMIYSFEKKLGEYERQEKVHASQREEHIQQVSMFQRQHSKLDVSINELKTKHEQLDHEMNVVKGLNKRLQYQNCHQQCILDQKTGELTTLKQQLLDTKIKVKVEPEKVKQREEELTREIKQLKCQNSQLEEDNQVLFTDCDSWKQKYWDGLKRLDEAHRLLNVHLHNAAQYRDEHLAEIERKKLVQEKLDATEAELAEVTEKAEKILEDYKHDKDAWTDEKEKLRSDIEDVRKQLEESKEQSQVAEEKLEKSSIYTVELEHKLSDAQAILNVDKLTVESQTDLHMLEMLNCGTQVSPDTQCKELQVEVAIETKVTQTIDPSFCSVECQTDSDVKVHKDVGSQVVIETTQQAIQTDSDSATTTHLENAAKDVESDEVKAVDTDLRKAQNEETCIGKFSNDCILQNVDNITSNVGTDNVGRDFPQISESIAEVHSELETQDVVKGVTIIISDSEDEQSPKNGEKDGDEMIDVRSDGNIYNQSLHQDTEMAGPMTEETLFNTHDVEAKNIGLKIPNIDVKTVVGNVAVDPEEFSIALSQDKTNEASDSSHSFHADMNVNKKVVYSGGHQVNMYSRNLNETNNTEKPPIESNWQVKDEFPKLFKQKSRKHKLTKDTVDEHFSSFNMTKSMFESSANDDEENAFQAKQPKLHKTKLSTNLSSSKKVKQFNSMFQKSANVIGNAESAEQVEKHSNIYPDPVIPSTATSTIQFNVANPTHQSESLSLHKMSYEATSGGPSFTAASSFTPVSVAERSHTAYQTSNCCPASTNTSVEQTSTCHADTDNNSGNYPDRVTTTSTTGEASRTTNDQTSSLTSHRMVGQTQSVTKSTGSVVDKSTSKSRGSADFLQKYRDIVANLKRPNTSNVAQEPFKHSIVNYVLPSNSCVSHSNNNVSHSNSDLVPSSTSVEKKDTSLNETIVDSPGTTPGGILKDVRRKRKPSRNVTWSEYVAHKEFITQSASEENSQDTT